jgi:hypothetical protein
MVAGVCVAISATATVPELYYRDVNLPVQVNCSGTTLTLPVRLPLRLFRGGSQGIGDASQGVEWEDLFDVIWPIVTDKVVEPETAATTVRAVACWDSSSTGGPVDHPVHRMRSSS